MDRDTKLITAWKDTPAQVHDSQALEAMLRSPGKGGAEIHADSAYRSAEQEIRLIETGHVSQINEKGHARTRYRTNKKQLTARNQKFVYQWSMSLGR